MSTLAEFTEKFPDFTWDYTASFLKERTQNRIQTSKSLVDRLVQLEEGKLNFENFLKPLAYDEGHFDRERNMIELIQCVSPSQEIRDAATECSKLYSDFIVELGMRKDLYDILCKIRKIESQLTPENDRYLNKLLLYKRRNGLHLPKDDRDKLEALFKKIVNLCIEFNRNIAEEDVKLKFTSSELIGMKQDYLDSLVKSDDSFIVTLKYPDVTPLLKYCQVVSTRQVVEKAFNSRCINTNVHILNELIKLRYQCSQILGYKTHVDYVTEILMSKNAQTVHEFLISMISKLRSSTKREMERLLELKKHECEKNHVAFDEKINPYDFNYYQRIVEELDFSVNHDVIQEYFPFDHVNQQVMEIYQTLLHLRFTKIDGAPTWHPEVSLYSVCDSDDNTLLGYFYLDLFPREGKYTHAACFGIEASYETESGRQVACAAMVANFTKPLPTKPSLLTHQEVETFFHEFGHVMHHICSIVHLTFFHGTSVERDFVEAPSQMLENWVWEKESLKKISCHYKTKECLSDDLVDKLIKSRKANIAIQYSRQLVLGTFDHIIHTSSQSDTFQVYKTTMLDLLGIEPTPGTNFSAAFGHMAGGYDAQYYGYLWSEVFSCDMFVSRFKKEGIFNPSTGLSYRKCILEPGSTQVKINHHFQDANDLLKKFLGREPIQEPFLELAGILHPSAS